jgi:phage shock protein A
LFNIYFEPCSTLLIWFSPARKQTPATRRTTMFQSLSLLLRSMSTNASAQMDQTLALPLLREHIQEAARSVQHTRHATALLCAQKQQEEKRLTSVLAKIADLESRTREAIAANHTELSMEGATAILNLEKEAQSLKDNIALYSAEETRLRALVLDAENRLRSLDRGARVASAKALSAKMQGQALPTVNGLDGAEERLRQIQDRQDIEQATRDAAKSLIQEGRTESIREKLANAGFGAPLEQGVQDILARLKATPTPTLSKAS